jgi:hypothetical protein
MQSLINSSLVFLNKTWDSLLACVRDRTFELLQAKTLALKTAWTGQQRVKRDLLFGNYFRPIEANKQNPSWFMSVSLFSDRWTFLDILQN